VLIAVMPTMARAQGSSSLHAGTVHIENEKERGLFASLRCLCGGCARDPLSTCACPWADKARAALRAELAAGKSREEIIDAYAAAHGTEALSIPPDRGALKSIYLVPLSLIAAGGVGLAVVMRRWRRNDDELHSYEASPADGSVSAEASAATGDSSSTRSPQAGRRSSARMETVEAKAEYDARLDDELKDLDG
jgi:cytochrome c-type biogenesis protein CcmH/NrfF